MKYPEPARARQSSVLAGVDRPGLSFIGLTALWTLIVASLGGWHYHETVKAFTENSRTAARYSIQKDLAYRLWAAEHGGVYVPVTDRTPPNPHLSHLPERDITTPSGRALTLLNSAYMTRQVHEMAHDRFGSREHVTSLNPLHPESTPDAWETEALRTFKNGATELSTVERMDDGASYLRLMQPFLAEEGCLKCHAAQGYQVGDLLGAISVAIPWASYRHALSAALPGLGFGYGGVWLFGLICIGLHRRKLGEYLYHRRKADEETRQLLQRLQKLADHLPGMIYQYRLYPDGRSCFPYSSDRIRDIYGLHPVEVITDASPVFAVLHPDDHESVASRIFASAETLSVWHDQYRVNHPSRHMLWVEGWATPEPLDDGSILWHGYIQDISARKQSEEVLAQQAQALQQRTVEMERFNYTVSHDLKTPLVTIEAFVGFLKLDLDNHNSEAVARDISFISKATSRMSQLLDALLHISGVSHIVNAPTQTSFQEVVQDALVLVSGPLLKTGVKVNLTAADSPLYGDRSRLIEIWQNLIDNAVKYRGDHPHPAIDIGMEHRDGDPVFFVRDNGMGIKPEYVEKIFGLFDQLDKNSVGSGLGLALVKRIVELNGGRIWVESDGVGQGSCFRFTLPKVTNHQDKEVMTPG